jgi:hypothetical protein
MKTRQPIPGQTIIELDERSSSATTLLPQERPPSGVSQKEEGSTEDPGKTAQDLESRLNTKIRNLEERVARLEGENCCTSRASMKLIIASSKQGNTRAMENLLSVGTSSSPQNVATRRSLEAGSEYPVSSVSYTNHIGYSSSSRTVCEPPATNCQLTGQLYNVNLERAMHANNGVNWDATRSRLENMLCRSCRHDRSGIRIFNFADASGTVALSLPNCQLPQQWYYSHRWSDLSSSIVFYYLLHNIQHLTVHENAQVSPRFSVGDHRHGGRHSPDQPSYIDGELRRYNIGAVYRQDCNAPYYRTSPFP